ncbi:hypothetical protein Tco_0053796 [Tanacetum coccineum]
MQTLEEKQIDTENDDDDFYRESINETPPSDAITPDLPITNSLVMEDEHPYTIPGIMGFGDRLYFLLRKNSIPPGIDSDGYDFEEDNLFLKYEPDPGELTRVVVEDIFGEPRVHMPNVLPTHPTLCQDLDFTLSTDFSGSDLVVSFPSRNRNKTFDPGISIEVQSKRLSITK